MSKIDIKSIFKNLSEKELIDVISVAQEMLSDLFSYDKIKDSVKESRFSKGYECPKCQCKDVNKNGKSNGRQRYICRTRKERHWYGFSGLCFIPAYDCC